jgi:predicted nucleic acid-binding protein
MRRPKGLSDNGAEPPEHRREISVKDLPAHGWPRSALELVVAYSLSFWDAAIVAAARSAHCDVLLTEDLSHGMSYGAVRVQNPFLQG